MKKTEKKEEKQKAGKKKDTNEEDSMPKIPEQLTREFNKKMKALMKEVKKEAKREIKNIMKEARQKIKENAELIMHDLLKTSGTESQNITVKEDEIQEIIPEKNEITAPEGVDQAESVNIPSAATRKTTSRSKKPIPSTGQSSEVTKPSRSRKPSSSKETITNNAEANGV